MSATPKQLYDESKIKTLSSLEHIRTRSGMYIGRLGDGTNPDDGIYVLLKEVIDNAIDEFIMGHGQKVVVQINDLEAEIRDYGRGIPLGKVIDCVSKINTGAKYNDDVFQFSVGLNGVGTKAVNALSESFIITSYRDGQFHSGEFSKGVLLKENSGTTTEPNGTKVFFRPDTTIFPAKTTYKDDFLLKRFKNYAYLNKGLKIVWNNKEIVSQHGLLDLLEEEMQGENIYPPVFGSSKMIDFTFTHSLNYGESYFSFVNGQYTKDGGTHLSAFKEAILKGINEYTQKNFQGLDVREGVIGAIAVKVKEPIFESQTKNKLGNTDIKMPVINFVKDEIVQFLHKNKSVADKIIEKIKLNEKVRMELQSVRKEARDKAKKIAIKIPNLKDCKHHLGDGSKFAEETMLFLTEGQSASGSMVSSRNVLTQAIFSLRGKPLNVLGMKMDTIYKNEEMYNIMQALNVENGIEGLRYNKIILATDSDVDGLHIRNLLMTFFIHFFEPLVLAGHLYILETPLFRVRNSKKTIYCFSEGEKLRAINELGNNPEITRFKGLGEISPKEFGQFIGKEIRLLPVTVNHIHDIHEKMNFCMGKNTPERRDFIMTKLV